MSDHEIHDSAEAIAEFKSLMADPAARQAFVELRATRQREGARVKYEHVLRAVSETPWAIRPNMLGVIIDLLAFRAAGGRLTPDEIEGRIGAARRPVTPGPQGVAVLPLHGVIVPKASMFSEMSGGTSIDSFRAQFREAMTSPEVKAVVMDVDSPGGMVDGVPEMAAEIRAARGRKPVVAVANTEAASAAYWLAAQADEIVVSQSSRVGSIGVFTAHEDESKRNENEGVKTTLVSAGKFKTEGNPFEPLTDEARSALQRLVDDYYGMFVRDVAAGRGVDTSDVRNGFGEGRVVGAADAIGLGMAERLGTLEQTVRALLVEPAGVTAAAAMAPTVTTVSISSIPPTSTTTSIPLANTTTSNEPIVAEVDQSAWDGNRAMGQCDTAAEYRSICAGEHNVGEPDQRQHWALPHHYLGQGPNAAGVRNALARLPQTQDLANREAAQGHLDSHMREINPEREEAMTEEEHLRATLAALSE